MDDVRQKVQFDPFQQDGEQKQADVVENDPFGPTTFTPDRLGVDVNTQPSSYIKDDNRAFPGHVKKSRPDTVTGATIAGSTIRPDDRLARQRYRYQGPPPEEPSKAKPIRNWRRYNRLQ